ncbi:BAG family molecular chaperone regulator 5, mitochondrial [Prosopis cineraria]|uniref:BAG family molecular chaperone regulator 5, mitochondrial n=1 Tax=Prosopis cineraria TaxID=364024 RepID=UPI0024107991|nr:BAG family molecular chaperone regulator 5, mitochondrial [Prosopis cineraria]
MKPSHKPVFFSSYSSFTTATYTTHNNDLSTPRNSHNSNQVPVVRPRLSPSNAALKIQSAYRSHRIRVLYRRIAAVDSEADRLQRLIQRQDTVDAVRSNELEKLKMNEALMALLLRLDSVPGINPTVREARRKVSRRIVGLQEILDSVCESKVDAYNWWGRNGLMSNWADFVADMEESVCRERGGEEMERFSAQNLGFRCLERFLRQP